jgi:WD40 repeat protein
MSTSQANGHDEVEVAHEALIKHWPRLGGWLDEHRSAYLLRESVSEAAQEWERHGRDESYLAHRGRRLAQAETLTEMPWLGLNDLEQSYLQASAALREREEREREAQRQRELASERERAELAEAARREAEKRVAEQAIATEGLRRRLLVAAVLGVLAVLAAAGALYGFWQADQQRNRAQAARVQNLSRQLQAQSRNLAGEEFDLALLLSLQADRLLDTLEAKGAMLDVLQGNPRFGRYTPVDDTAVNGLALNPVDGALASTSDSGAVRLWESVDGTSRIISEGHLTRAASPVFSADGGTLAFGGCGQVNEAGDCEQGQIVLWDVASGQERTRFTCPAIPEDLAWSPDGRNLGASCDGALYGWDLSRDGEDQATGHQDGLDLFAVSPAPDSPYLAVDTGGGAVVVFNTAADEEHATLQRPQPVPLGAVAFDLEFSPGGEMLAASYSDGTIVLWDVESGALAGDPLNAASSVVQLAFSPDGATIAGLDLDGALSLWDVQTGETRGESISGHRGGITSFALGPNGILTTGGADGRLARWNLGADYRVGRLLHEGFFNADAAFSADSRRLAVVTTDITVWNLETLQRMDVNFMMPREYAMRVFNPRCLAFAPDGNTLAAGTIDGSIVRWDAETGRQLGQVLAGDEHEGTLGCTVAYSPNGQLLAYGLTGGDQVTLWDPTSRQRRVQSLTTPALKRAVFSPDSQRLLTVSVANEALLWDVTATPATSEPVEPEPSGVVDGAFWSERLLMMVSNDGDIWRADASGSPPTYEVLSSLTVDPERIALSPATGLLATGGQGGRLQLLDAASGLAISELTEGRMNRPTGLAFSSDGRWLVSWMALPSRKMMLWDVGFASWLAQACQLAGRNLTPEEWDRFGGADVPFAETCPALFEERDAPSAVALGTPEAAPRLAVGSPAP